MSGITKIVAMVACLAVLAVDGRGAERMLVFTAIDFPGATLTNAQGINAGGEIVGAYNDAASPSRTHGFVLSGGHYQSIDFPGARATVARGIGPGGDIVGSYQKPNESGGVPSHGFLLDNHGAYFRVDHPDHLNTIAQRILPDGTILGCYHDDDTMDSMHGLIMSPRDGLAAIPEGMSMHNGATPDGRLIVGLFTDSDGRSKGYFVNRGVFEPFEVPGAAATSGWDINQAGVAVGVYRDSAGKIHGFQFDGREFRRIDFPGAMITRVFGINAGGDMVGNYVDTSGRTHGFIAQWGPAE